MTEIPDEKEPLEKSSVSEESDTEDDSKCGPSTILKEIGTFLFRNYLALGLAFLAILGVLVPAPGVFISQFPTLYICTIGIFLHSGIMLKNGEVLDAFKAYRGLVLGMFLILFLTPIIGVKLTSTLPFEEPVEPAFVEPYTKGNNSMNITLSATSTVGPIEHLLLGVVEFRTGIQIYFVVPCTISSGMIMTAQAGGNSALALMLTVICNLCAVFTVPLLLSWLIALKGVTLDPLKLFISLVLTVLFPLMVGKGLRFISRVQEFVDKRAKVLKCVSITLLIILPWMKISQSSADGRLQDVFIGSLFAFLGWGLTLHFLFIIIVFPMCLILKLDRPSLKAVVVMGSQKSVAVSLTVITFMPVSEGEQGLITLPVIIIHLGILLVDAFLVSHWQICDPEDDKSLDSDQQDEDDSSDEACPCTRVLDIVASKLRINNDKKYTSLASEDTEAEETKGKGENTLSEGQQR